MGNRDIVTKDYMADPIVFADAFNYFLYKGRQVVKPERLRKKDTTAVVIPYGKDGEYGAVQKYHDNLMALTRMTDDKAEYIILGIEGQADVNYAMSVRNMLYDALQYAEQVKEKTKTHRKKRDLRGGEFLSGFSKGDKLLPVITLVILFNPKTWDGPMNLHEMLLMEDESLMDFVQDYKLNLMVPATMRDEEINRLSSSLREVIMFLKYAADDEQMDVIMKQNDRFKKLDRKAANVLNTLMNCGLEIDDDDEEVDMCIAWDRMKEKAYKEGERVGIEKMCASIENLMFNTGWSREKAMEALGIPEEDRTGYYRSTN